MLFLTFSNVWSILYFFFIFYLVSIVIIVTYVTSFISTNVKVFNSKQDKIFNVYRGVDFFFIYSLIPIFVLFFNNLWVCPNFTAWFGHVLVTSFQFKFSNFLSSLSLIVFAVILSNFFFTSRNIYDFMSTLIFFYYWLLFLFFTNSIFAAIFIIEVLSSLVFLFIITSSFTSTVYYNNVNSFIVNFSQSSYPNSYLKSLIFFFWISLITSIFLFLFLIIFFLRFLTLDWFIFEFIFSYAILTLNLSDLLFLSFVWLLLLVSIFLKCGIAPFFLWKPTFFKGLPTHTLFFYVTFFYFYVYIYFIYLVSVYFTDFLYFYSYILMIFVSFGFFLLLSILLESMYIKVFLAMSSILNSLFVLMSLTVPHCVDFYFWL